MTRYYKKRFQKLSARSLTDKYSKKSSGNVNKPYFKSSHSEERSWLDKKFSCKKKLAQRHVQKPVKHFNPLRANSTKWSNTLKQFVGC